MHANTSYIKPSRIVNCIFENNFMKSFNLIVMMFAVFIMPLLLLFKLSKTHLTSLTIPTPPYPYIYSSIYNGVKSFKVVAIYTK